MLIIDTDNWLVEITNNKLRVTCYEDFRYMSEIFLDKLILNKSKFEHDGWVLLSENDLISLSFDTKQDGIKTIKLSKKILNNLL